LRNTLGTIFAAAILTLFTFSCTVKWTEAIHFGKVVQDYIPETVDIKIQNRLIVVSVAIRGKSYRFLFDTGAPFSISQQLQQDHQFKIISKGKIVDSDHNRKQVDWAQVDSISIGGALFLDQTAFVGDFEANPLMKCLQIDGIIGSNLIRQSNWTIDQEQQTLSISSIDAYLDFGNSISIPFQADYQYNMFIDVGFGKSTVKHVLVDYGSNGSIALSNEIFSILEDRNVFDTYVIEKGVKQSGIIGSPVALERKITFSDSVKLNELSLKSVLVKTGETVSIGNQLLSRFQVTIDWKNKRLYLTEPIEETERVTLTGLRMGYSDEKGIYVQSVIEGSNADQAGIRPDMKVLKFDSLDFEGIHDFCDYAGYSPRDSIAIQLIDSLGVTRDISFRKTLIK
jgi:hypothetical protein